MKKILHAFVFALSLVCFAAVDKAAAGHCPSGGLCADLQCGTEKCKCKRENNQNQCMEENSSTGGGGED
ncbi:MAG: hypothetical protein AB7K52_10830 [Phycisphaerales bacterium]